MSHRNVELLRRANEAFNERDIGTFIALCDSQIEFQPVFAAVGRDSYRGHDGMRRWQRDLEDAWGEELRSEPEAYFDLGEHTLMFHVLRGRGKQSGAEVAMPAAAVARWRDGLCVYFKGYAQRDDALRDLGVSEDTLEPIVP